MRWSAALLALVLALPASAAEVEVNVRTGGMRLHVGDDGVRFRSGRLPGTHRGDRDRRDHRRPGHHRPPTVVIIREPAPEVAEPAPPPPEPAPAPKTVAPEPAAPPDPAGPGQRIRARTAAPEAPVWQIGEPLPARLPQVTLAPGRYDLPAPPAGEIYVRIGRDVLRIEAATRRVVAVVEP